jgi:hypothetical protein
MKYNELSAKQGRAATVAELSRHLHSVRYAIDNDIKTNGYTRFTAPNHGLGLAEANELPRRGASMRYKTTYAIMKPVNQHAEPKMEFRDTKLKSTH